MDWSASDDGLQADGNRKGLLTWQKAIEREAITFVTEGTELPTFLRQKLFTSNHIISQPRLVEGPPSVTAEKTVAALIVLLNGPALKLGNVIACELRPTNFLPTVIGAALVASGRSVDIVPLLPGLPEFMAIARRLQSTRRWTSDRCDAWVPNTGTPAAALQR